MTANPVNFWTIFKADALFALCSFLLSTAILLALAYWRRRKARRTTTSTPGSGVALPKVMVIGGKDLEPGHCPLCGHSWPLPGPDKPKQGDQ